jgi:hypothetical protein
MLSVVCSAYSQQTSPLREELGEKRGTQPPTLDFLDLAAWACFRRWAERCRRRHVAARRERRGKERGGEDLRWRACMAVWGAK